ncbi:MAG: hypothetical protein A3E19_03130 [Planctomycetes bacterium RIFCSPHIGHO2_12_FULL_52_36]|nr:MAG: hypothetical protein A3E19_03130 [Planctomycetes bacterium RIFCSPHIGHO2_12_FULL_52_36]
MSPALIMSLWLGISASEGSSLSVGIRVCDHFMVIYYLVSKFIVDLTQVHYISQETFFKGLYEPGGRE